MKTCNKCGQEKALSEFHKRSDAKDGLQGTCKVCQLENGRRRYKANPEQVCESVRRY